MKDLISPDISLAKVANPGNIKIVNSNNETLEIFENNLECVSERNKNLKPGNYLIVNNPNFKIIFSCNYINEWVSKRKRTLFRNLLKKNNTLTEIGNGRI